MTTLTSLDNNGGGAVKGTQNGNKDADATNTTANDDEKHESNTPAAATNATTEQTGAEKSGPCGLPSKCEIL